MSSISEDSSSSLNSSNSSASSSQVGGNPGEPTRSTGYVGNVICPIKELAHREVNSRRDGAIESSSSMEIIVPQLRNEEEQRALNPFDVPLQLAISSRRNAYPFSISARRCQLRGRWPRWLPLVVCMLGWRLWFLTRSNDLGLLLRDIFACSSLYSLMVGSGSHFWGSWFHTVLGAIPFLSQLTAGLIQNMVRILMLAVECSLPVCYRCFEKMSSIKKVSKKARRFYVNMKSRFNIIISHPIKVNDWHMHYFYIKRNEVSVHNICKKYKADWLELLVDISSSYSLPCFPRFLFYKSPLLFHFNSSSRWFTFSRGLSKPC